MNIEITDCGATYNSPAAIPANDLAFLKAIEALRPTGGTIQVSSPLFISKTITFPTVANPGNANIFPVPFGIVGNGVSSRLLKSTPGFSIDATIPDIYPATVPNADMRSRVERLSLHGGGLRVSLGGKYLVVRDVSISGCNDPVALDVDYYDGGILDRINVHDNANMGVRITRSHHTRIDITTRGNGTGGLISDSVLYGSLYPESNKGLGFDFQHMTESYLQVWAENNGGRFQMRKRDCYRNTFAGHCQQYGGQAFDDDPISAAANTMLPGPAVDVSQVGGVFGTSMACHTDYPDADVQCSGSLFTVQPSAFDNHNPNLWVEFLPSASESSMGGAWHAGDYVLLNIAVTAYGVPTWTFLESVSVPALRFMTNDPSMGLNVWLPTPTFKTTMIGKTASDGSNLRVFCYPTIGGVKPPQALKFLVTVEARWLGNGHR